MQTDQLALILITGEEDLWLPDTAEPTQVTQSGTSSDVAADRHKHTVQLNMKPFTTHTNEQGWLGGS